MSEIVVVAVGPRTAATTTASTSTTSTAAVATLSSGLMLVSNNSASPNWMFIKFGDSAVGAATVADTPVPPNGQLVVDTGGSTHYRAILSAGTGAVYVTPLANG